MPKNMQTNKSHGVVPRKRSNNQPTRAPPAGPAISSVKTRFPCRIPLAGTWSLPERTASAFRAAFSCMSNESSRASLLPFLFCPGSFETMRFILLLKGNHHEFGATPPRHRRFRRAPAPSQQATHEYAAAHKPVAFSICQNCRKVTLRSHLNRLRLRSRVDCRSIRNDNHAKSCGAPIGRQFKLSKNRANSCKMAD